MEFKNTLIKSITAVLCVAAICISAVIGVGKIGDAKIEAAKASGTASSAGTQSGDTTPFEDGTTEDTAAPADEATSDAAQDQDAAADASADSTATDAEAPQQSSDSSSSSDAAPASSSSSSSSSSMPTTTAAILSYYNNATAKVVSTKAGYSKTRVVDNEKIEANLIFKQFKSLIYQFMGIGADNKYTENVAKGKWGENPYFLASKLSASDVTGAKCVKSGSDYVITINVKNGSSAANKSKPTTPANAPLDRTGICVGTEDKARFDHKTASVIYDAIQGTFKNADVKESYNNAVVKATINASTGNISSLTVTWNMNVTIDIGGAASASGISHVTFSNFKY